VTAEAISIQVSIVERGLARYTANALAAHMLACVVDACDSNKERFEVLVSNKVPPAVAGRLLLDAGYTRPDRCKSCEVEVGARDAVIVLAERRVKHARCREAR